MPNIIRGLPEGEFEYEQERINFQFALMLKMRYGLEKRYEITLSDFRKRASVYLEPEQVEKAIVKIIHSAYLTIPEGFWREAEKYNRVAPIT